MIKQLDLEDEFDGSITFDYFGENNKMVISMFEDCHYVGEFNLDAVRLAKLVEWIKNEVDIEH